MRKRIILSLFFLFALFTIGAGFSTYYISATSSQLNSLVNLHQVEIMREDLIISIQTVQSDLYTVNTIFGEELDSVVEHVARLEEAVERCQNCHHLPHIQEQIDGLQPMLAEYKYQLSRVITTSADRDRVLAQMAKASDIGNQMLGRAQQMSFVAQRKLHDRTIGAIREIDNSKNILLWTLVGAFFIALTIAISLTKGITKPVQQLLDGARSMAAGDFQQPITYSVKNEFGELAVGFNNMRLALQESKDRIMAYVRQLSGLYGITLSIHAVSDTRDTSHDFYGELAGDVSNLLNVEQCGLILYDEELKAYRHRLPVFGLPESQAGMLLLPETTVKVMFKNSENGTYISNNPSADNLIEERWPLAREHRNIILSWIQRQGRVIGAIWAANKREEIFHSEDAQVLSILANQIAVAFENRRLYANLRNQMNELSQAQAQLVQSTKLAAIGELASNVAHEINNPLTSILGYTELLKEEEDLDAIRNDLEIIEQESLRARMIVRQLLEFSRRRPLEIRETDICSIIGTVIPLVQSKAKANRVTIRQKVCALPAIAADVNQLQQVFINIINNAIFAMEGGGVLTISTDHNEDSVFIRFQDTGPGIPENIRNRIFEPFFSTKQEKGTGLGLSISYSIIQKHGGDIRVEAEDQVGSTFIISLPKKFSTAEIVEA